ARCPLGARPRSGERINLFHTVGFRVYPTQLGKCVHGRARKSPAQPRGYQGNSIVHARLAVTGRFLIGRLRRLVCARAAPTEFSSHMLTELRHWLFEPHSRKRLLAAPPVGSLLTGNAMRSRRLTRCACWCRRIAPGVGRPEAGREWEV